MKARLTEGKAGLAARLACAVALSLALAACAPKNTVQQAPEPNDKAVATLNGQTVWASDVKREAVAQGLIGQGEPLDVSSDLFHQVLDEVIDQKLLAAEAIKRKIDKDPAAQRRLAAARERILGDILLENSVGKAVNDDAINGLYQEMLKTQTPTEQIQLRRIVVASQAEGDQIVKLLKGGASFDTLAAQRSKDDTTRFSGGLLKPLTTDMLPEGYAAALKDAKTGQVVGPFKTEEGFVVARVDDRRQEAPITLEAARPQIVRFLTYDQVKDLILKLRSKAAVKTLIGPPADVPGTPREPASAPPPLAIPGGEAPAGAPPSAEGPAGAAPASAPNVSTKKP
ncbi:peptidylprolyl isomerase [Caulobacter sp. KR2-114]|uniref:peptidylprolyl isomerase n=1 Tax=Caulobacter sp. KR2-114 TaxID=3400912 RepID=UPI003BFCE191